mgnify:CR=1 FL=1
MHHFHSPCLFYSIKILYIIFSEKQPFHAFVDFSGGNWNDETIERLDDGMRTYLIFCLPTIGIADYQFLIAMRLLS